MKTKKIEICSFMFCIIFTTSVVMGMNAHAQGIQEYEIKAAFLYNFAKFVTWPEDTFGDQQSPLIIGVLGENPFGGALKSVEEKTVQGRQIIVKHFNTEKDIEHCHILYIGSSEKDRMVQLLSGDLSKKEILTVGSMAQFTQSGGVINFVIQGNKTKFEINRESANRAGLKISSKLLKLAILPK